MEKKWWQSSVVYQIYPRSFQDIMKDFGTMEGDRSEVEKSPTLPSSAAGSGNITLASFKVKAVN